MRPILCVVGTRPNYMKMAPILAAFDAHVPRIPYGQLGSDDNLGSCVQALRTYPEKPRNPG